MMTTSMTKSGVTTWSLSLQLYCSSLLFLLLILEGTSIASAHPLADYDTKDHRDDDYNQTLIGYLDEDIINEQINSGRYYDYDYDYDYDYGDEGKTKLPRPPSTLSSFIFGILPILAVPILGWFLVWIYISYCISDSSLLQQRHNRQFNFGYNYNDGHTVACTISCCEIMKDDDDDDDDDDFDFDLTLDTEISKEEKVDEELSCSLRVSLSKQQYCHDEEIDPRSSNEVHVNIAGAGKLSNDDTIETAMQSIL
jgi:hypothetical protein